ncbi:MAG: Ig-like domain-containing protein [Verrucomicrobia bacterium]|nr:Ig-like domain-containing protein [Verrucomicrobiota bacterium]
MKRSLFAIAGCLALTSTLHAQAPVTPDIIAPEVTLSTPDTGATVTRKVTVSGTVTDAVGVKEVLYRIEGSSRWRKAILTEADATSTDFVVLATFKKGQHGRIYIRAIDAAGNESDTIGRKYIISK